MNVNNLEQIANSQIELQARWTESSMRLIFSAFPLFFSFFLLWKLIFGRPQNIVHVKWMEIV